MEDEVLATEIDLLKRGKVDVVKMAASLKAYRELLLMCYVYEVQNGLKRLEDLDPEFKKLIWEETKKESAGLNKNECIELSKIVYLISSKL